jgi:hypothetical protein
MRLQRILPAAALAAAIGAPLVTATPALAFGIWGTPGYSVQLQLPAMMSPWPQVAQVPLFGGPRYVAEQPPIAPASQTAELTADTGDHAPTFVAPGVDQNAAGQLQKSH